MATPKVLLKRSSVAGKVPTASDLDYGELAINFQDGKIYYKDASNNITISELQDGLFLIYEPNKPNLSNIV